MRTYALTQEQYQALRDEATRALGDEEMRPGIVLDILNALEAEPEAPNDWSGHKDYGICGECVYYEKGKFEYPCERCIHWGDEVDHWQPRTP